MLTAKKEEYTEIYYPKTLYNEQPTSSSQVAEISKSRMIKWERIMPVVVVLVGFSLCTYTVNRFAIIAQKQEEIATLEEHLEKQLGIQEHLKLNLTTKGDLRRIEEFAKVNLDMGYPNKEQVLFVELPEKNLEKDTTIAMGILQKESLWTRIIRFLE